MISAIESVGLIAILTCLLGVLCALSVRKTNKKEFDIESVVLVVERKGRRVYIRSEDRQLRARYVFSCVEAADHFYTNVCKNDETNERSEEE